jgi:hypothetical protein
MTPSPAISWADGRDDPELVALLKDAKRRVDAMTPEQREAMWESQRQSWLRAFGPCEHGDYDFETCEQCLAAYIARTTQQGG